MTETRPSAAVHKRYGDAMRVGASARHRASVTFCGKYGPSAMPSCARLARRLAADTQHTTLT